MYLLVFTTIVISMIGVYAQVMAVEAGRIAARQHGIAEAMLAWHAAAISLAASIIDTNPTGYAAMANGPAGGCGLTWSGPLAASTSTYNQCPTPSIGIGGSSVNANQPFCSTFAGTMTSSNANGNILCNIYNPTTGAAESVHLSSTFQQGTYQFYSYLYKDAGGSDYVVTFLPSTTGASNPAHFLSLVNVTGAGGAQIGLTASDLMHQLHHTNAPQFAYGAVSVAGGVAILTSSGFQFTLPAYLASVTGMNGAVAIIGSPDGF